MICAGRTVALLQEGQEYVLYIKLRVLLGEHDLLRLLQCFLCFFCKSAHHGSILTFLSHNPRSNVYYIRLICTYATLTWVMCCVPLIVYLILAVCGMTVECDGIRCG